jgi:hypothetical protein
MQQLACKRIGIKISFSLSLLAQWKQIGTGCAFCSLLVLFNINLSAFNSSIRVANTSIRNYSHVNSTLLCIPFFTKNHLTPGLSLSLSLAGEE